jgi:hypothetical protein
LLIKNKAPDIRGFIFLIIPRYQALPRAAIISFYVKQKAPQTCGAFL